VEVEAAAGIHTQLPLVHQVVVTVIQLLAQPAQLDRDLEAAQDEVIVQTVIQPVVVAEPVVPEAIGVNQEVVNLPQVLGDNSAKAATVARA
jgi:hypothetical protein